MSGEYLTIPVDGKNFIGIGKMMIDNLNSEWNIPHLHFIINKTPSGLFEATNLEFILDASGENIEEAVEILSGLTLHYITSVMSNGRGYDEFIEKVNSMVMEQYWRAYRDIEFSLARKRKDLSHELSSRINAAIKNMLADNIKQRVKEVAADLVDTIITNMNIQVTTLEAA
jgi:hypothetical protein